MFSRRSIFVKEDFGKFQFPVKESALPCAAFRPEEERTKTLELIDIELPPSQLDRAFFDGFRDDGLKLRRVLPRTDLVGMNVEKFDEGFVILLWKLIAEAAGGPEIGHGAERQ